MVEFGGKEIPVTVEDGVRPKARAAPRVTTPNGSPRRAPTPDPEPQPFNREQGVLGIFQMVAAGLMMVDPVDAATVANHAPGIANAVAETAANDARFGALLDKILHVGPYGALLAAIMPLACQLAVNHGLLKPGMMGTLSREQILEAITQPEEAKENGSHLTPVS